MKRRKFLENTSLGTLGGFGFTNTLINFRMLQNLQAASSGPDDYKALVCVFLRGGNDSFNMLVPTSSAEYANYREIRSDLSLAEPGTGTSNDLLPINVTNTGNRTFGIHPQLINLRNRFNEGNAAMIANVGPSVQPTTVADVESRNFLFPRGAFAHNTQQDNWYTSVVRGAVSAQGWAGRLADKVMSCNTSNNISMNILAHGDSLFLSGNTAFGYNIGRNGSTRLSGSTSTSGVDAQRVAAARDLVNQDPRYLLGQAFAQQKRDSYANSENFFTGFNNVNLSTSFGRSGESGRFESIAKTIAARNTFGHRRQIFMVALDGYDTHGSLIGPHNNLMRTLDQSLNEFWDSMVNQGLENNVTVFSASDFGRSIRSNGGGTDHAWGGHSFVLGGAVNGRRIYGEYPDENEMVLGGGLDVGTNGRYAPTTSIDSYFAELALWFGLDPSDLADVFPNLNRFYTYDPNNAPLGFLI